MILQGLKVLGYRGFASEQSLAFATPNGKRGSGLTVIVGPNNSGKSSLIEVISFLRAPGRAIEFTEGQKNAATNGQVRIEFATDSAVMTVDTGPSGAARWSMSSPPGRGGEVLAIPSRRGLDPSFPLNENARPQYSENLPDFAQRRSVGSPFPSRLPGIEARKADFRKVFGRVLPDAPNWYLEKLDSGSHYLKVTTGSSSHASDGLGQGVISSLHLIDALYDSSVNEIIAIDEPELSLHPSAQRGLFDVILEYASDRQVILATHSPYFAPIEYLDVGARIVRTSLRAKSSIISSLQPSTATKLAPLLEDRFNPHVLGLDAREVLFLEDDVILVEGQDDVLGYREVFRRLDGPTNASFFGWGVGGASKMELIALLLRDLGIRRVYGILDAGHDLEIARLRSTFPDYKCDQLPAPDIRTKEARPPVPEKIGLFDDKWELRPEWIEPTQALVTRAKDYLENPVASDT
jgi:predicted ATPase